MKNLIGYGALLAALVSGTPAFAAEGQGSHTEHRAMGMSMSDDSMQAMHESMTALKAEQETMRNMDSDEMKLRMMEKNMDAMTQHMEMMMNVMEGKKPAKHDHRKMK